MRRVCIFAYIYVQNYILKMKVTQIIIEKLLNDTKFRLNTALALGVTERNVYNLAKSKSDNLTKAAAVEYFKSTGLTEDEILIKA